MGDRGRTPAAELSVATVSEIPIRPNPPVDMPEDQRDIWRRIVGSMPADWFRPETLDLLEQYCRVVRTAAYVETLIANAVARAETDSQEMKRLTGMEKEISGVLATLATKMRISQQSTYDKEKAKGKVGRSPLGK